MIKLALRSVVLGCVAVSLFVASLVTARELGMADTLPSNSYARAAMSIGVSISRISYGAQGYLLYSPVINAITKGFDSGAVTQPGRLNRAITSAISIDLSRVCPAIEKDWGDDKGYSDFTTLAFELFGLRIESLFILYFALFSFACVLFFLRFYDDLAALATLVVYLAAHYMVVAVLPNSTVTAVVHDARFLPAISGISVIHWIFAATRPARRLWLDLGLLQFQAAVIFFVVDGRSSAAWQVIAIFCAALWLFFRSGERTRGGFGVAIVMLSCAALYVHRESGYAERYKKDGTEAHIVWHNVYMGLGFHPEAVKRFDLLPDDSTVYRHAAIFMNAHPDERAKFAIEKIAPPVFDKIGWRAYDRIARDMFFEFVLEHPGYVAASYLFYKPLYFVHEVAWQFGLVQTFPTWIELSGVHRATGDRRLAFFNPWILVAMAITFATAHRALNSWRPVAGVGFISALSLTPSFVVGPFYYEVSNVFILIAVLGIMSALMLCAFALRRMRAGRSLATT